jgi:hypothetical protein
VTRFAASLALALVAGAGAGAGAAAAAPHGVDVQVNEGGPVPTVAQLETVLSAGDFVRDILGWHHVDPNCNLRTDPALAIVIPPPMAQLHANVQAAGGKNFVALAFNNTACGQATTSGSDAFPDTDELRAEFAAYAVRVVRQVPALGGISIWNEFNGTWNGGYRKGSVKWPIYCLLANKVIAEVRKVDKTVPIAIGATVGVAPAGAVTKMFDKYGCVGKGDPSIWIDVHPYIGRNWDKWDKSAAKIRADGVTNPLIASEWGANPAYRWTQANPGGDYMTKFETEVLGTHGPWAGSIWFALLPDRHIPHASLFDENGALSPLGSQYVAAFKH